MLTPDTSEAKAIGKSRVANRGYAARNNHTADVPSILERSGTYPYYRQPVHSCRNRYCTPGAKVFRDCYSVIICRVAELPCRRPQHCRQTSVRICPSGSVRQIINCRIRIPGKGTLADSWSVALEKNRAKSHVIREATRSNVGDA